MYPWELFSILSGWSPTPVGGGWGGFGVTMGVWGGCWGWGPPPPPALVGRLSANWDTDNSTTQHELQLTSRVQKLLASI